MKKTFFRGLITTFIIFMFAWAKTSATEAGELTMHTINVLHGDAILIESKGHYMLVDSGESVNADMVLNYLAKLDIPDKNIDYVVATHPDGDHIGGFKNVYAEYNIGNTIFNDISKPIKSYTNFVNAVINEGTPFHNPVDNESWILGDAKVQVIYDGRQGTTFNESSIVLKVTCDNKKILLTADLPTTIENKLIAEGKYDFSADILKVGHHGATLSTSTAFLKKVNPSYAVISCPPKDEEFNLPKDAVLERLAKIYAKTYRTTDGDIVINIKDGVISTTAKENNPFKSISKGTIVLSSKLLTADPIAGKGVSPDVDFYLDGKLLDDDLYKTTFSGNTHTGTATVKVVGKEKGKPYKYVGSVSSKFNILPRKTKIYSAYRKTTKSVYVHWSAQKYASGYELQYATNKSFTKGLKKKTIKKSSTNSYTIKKLSKKKKYYIRVRAYTKKIGEGKWSPKAVIKKIKF